MANYFKTRFLPNPDGTDSATALTNSNTAFVHTYIGDDLTGDGTREFPFRSVYKANQKSGVSYIVFRGIVNEAFSTDKTIIGDDINQTLLTANYSTSVLTGFNFTTQDIPSFQYKNTSLCRVSGTTNVSHYLVHVNYCFSPNIIFKAYGNEVTNSTICNLSFEYQAFCNFKNNIVIHELDIISINYDATPKYTLFSSSTIFKYNGNVYTQPTWGYDSKANVQLARNYYLSHGMSQDHVDLLFAKDSFGNETCRIVKEARNGGTSANIFNRYDGSGNVLDYSLNPDSANEALYASDTGGYVGCFKPSAAVNSVSGNSLGSPINVLNDGSDNTGVSGTLLQNVSDQLSFLTSSAQIWNRIKGTNTIAIPNGIKFNGINAMSTDGSAFGYYFGKHQNLMNPTGLTTSDSLLQNTIYKVCNAARDIYSAVIYNGNQYLPDYFFKTDSTHLSFTLLNEGSGTVVKEVLASPLESIEIMPYDNMTTPSATFPKFSCPLFGNCLMLFHKIGENINKSVLFSEVTNDKIAYYDDWAVTNADQEFVTLAADTTNYYYALPTLKFLRIEINAHFNQDYDQ